MRQLVNINERINSLELIYYVKNYVKNTSGEFVFEVECKQCNAVFKKTYSKLVDGCASCKKQQQQFDQLQNRIDQKFGNNKFELLEHNMSDSKVRIQCLNCNNIIEIKKWDISRKKYLCEKCFKQKDLEQRKQEWLYKFYNKKDHEHYKIINYNYQGSQEKTIMMKCLIHNVEYMATPESIINTKGFCCQKCRYELSSNTKRKPLKYYIDQVKKIHPEYNYSKNIINKFVTQSERIIVICKKHGEFYPSIDNHLNLKTKCPKCSIEKQGINRRYSYDEIKENIIKSINDNNELIDIDQGDILSFTRITIKCKKHNNTYTKSYNSIINSKYNGCDYCRKDNQKEKYTQDLHHKINQQCLNFNCELLTDLAAIENSSDYITIKCKKHNNIFDRKIYNFLNGNTSGCHECISNKLRTSIYSYDEICQIINDYHPNFEILSDNKEQFINTQSIFKIKCPKHGIFERTVSSLIYEKYGCPKCSNRISGEEQEIHQFIEDFYNKNIIYNTRKIIKPKELDIYLPDLNLAIEYNGLLFHSFGKFFPNNWKVLNKFYHYDKTNKCNQMNIQLLHIFSNEWLDPIKQKIWKSVIRSKMGLINTRIYARKCEIKEISHKVARKFFEHNHLQGNSNASVYIGLFYNDELISCMSFNRSRFTNKYNYELIRFANKINIVVSGGASRLLKYFVRKYNPKSIVSYANKRWSNGHLYERLGFNFVGKSDPNYFYIDKNQRIYSRLHFQKHKIREYYKNDLYNINLFDESKNEKENMADNKYRIIYDSGNYVFEYIPVAT